MGSCPIIHKHGFSAKSQVRESHGDWNKSKFLQVSHLKSQVSAGQHASYFCKCVVLWLLFVCWWFFLDQKFSYVFNKLTKVQLRIVFTTFINQMIRYLLNRKM